MQIAAAAQQGGGGNAARGSSGRGAGRGGGGRGGGRGRGRRFDSCDQAPPAKQASFPGRFPEQPLTAIVGGGLSGLVCAQELARRGLRTVVFDTGEHGVGGRLATRASADGSLKGAPPGLVFDHAAQFFTATHPSFQCMVDQWEADGAVRRWDGPVGALRDGAFSPDPATQPRYVGARGMRSLATYLAGAASRALQEAQGGAATGIEGLVEVRQPQWVSEARWTPDGWLLSGRGRDQGLFDAVVIAHNGKCANRLASPMGVPQVHSQLRRLKLSANWALLVAFAAPVAVPGGLEGAFIQGSDVLSWAGNNSKKLGQAGGAECWTLFSTQAYGSANKVPQENVPAEVSERVTREMLAAFERSLGLAQGALPPVVYSRTQLWGAALPINSPRVPAIWDPMGRAGVCGDWVLEGGSMQAAALSGAALAHQIAASCGRQPTDLAGLALGLDTPFKQAGGEEIGCFPGQQQHAPPPQQQRQQGGQQREQQGARQQRQRRQQQASDRPAGWRRGAAAETETPPALLARPRRR
ncbi:hypothetical protein C2E20_4073 [Micractinium conductrix]|uniref:Uncharacterized protein n=1 Tax=Micractinium conductrix TaxID=554055 RepID=A0A2P6VFQ2_9CHLO|nr:hypothetical protein C2E20_4073 [Micractinium conductrix]|eukprot:PSC72920.1 hypothetical protein C2E20_4073 [Micractinium conductrix]